MLSLAPLISVPLRVRRYRGVHRNIYGLCRELPDCLSFSVGAEAEEHSPPPLLVSFFCAGAAEVVTVALAEIRGSSNLAAVAVDAFSFRVNGRRYIWVHITEVLCHKHSQRVWVGDN